MLIPLAKAGLGAGAFRRPGLSALPPAQVSQIFLIVETSKTFSSNIELSSLVCDYRQLVRNIPMKIAHKLDIN